MFSSIFQVAEQLLIEIQPYAHMMAVGSHTRSKDSHPSSF